MKQAIFIISLEHWFIKLILCRILIVLKNILTLARLDFYVLFIRKISFDIWISCCLCKNIFNYCRLRNKCLMGLWYATAHKIFYCTYLNHTQEWFITLIVLTIKFILLITNFSDSHQRCNCKLFNLPFLHLQSIRHVIGMN